MVLTRHLANRAALLTLAAYVSLTGCGPEANDPGTDGGVPGDLTDAEPEHDAASIDAGPDPRTSIDMVFATELPVNAVSVMADAEHVYVVGAGHTLRLTHDGTSAVELPISGSVGAATLDGEQRITTQFLERATDRWGLNRSLSTGDPDPGFGGGRVQFDAPPRLGAIDTSVASLALAPDGATIAVGTFLSRDPTMEDALWVARVLEDGRLDPGFGDGGYATVEAVDGAMQARRVRVQRDGRIVVAADGRAAAPLLLSFTPDGQLDDNFADGGILTTGLGTRGVGALEVDGEGAVYLATPALGGARVVRFSMDGRPDRGFGDAGSVELPLQGGVSSMFHGEGGLTLVGYVERGEFGDRSRNPFWTHLDQTGELVLGVGDEAIHELASGTNSPPHVAGIDPWGRVLLIYCTEVRAGSCLEHVLVRLNH